MVAETRITWDEYSHAPRFEALVVSLLSPETDQRSIAESTFRSLIQNHPQPVISRLSAFLFTSSFDLRLVSTKLLRSELDSTIWNNLDELARSSVKLALLSAIEVEDCKSIAKELCHTVAAIASSIHWPELFDFTLQRCIRSSSLKLQESGFLIISSLSRSCDRLITHSKVLHREFGIVLRKSWNLEIENLKIAALSAFINHLTCLKIYTRSPYVELGDCQVYLSLLMRNLINLGQGATEALSLLSKFARMEPGFFRLQIDDVVGSILLIVEAETLADETRHSAIKFLITLAEAEKAPKVMEKLSNLEMFVNRLFKCLLKLLLDVDSREDATWFSAEFKHESAGETSNFCVARECLNRLSIAFGRSTISVNVMYRTALSQLRFYLSSPMWQKVHATLIGLAQIAEGCSKEMIKGLAEPLNMALSSLKHHHPRVRWAALHAIGQLSTDLGPHLEQQYHELVLPALSAALDDIHCPRIVAHAASAVINVSLNSTPEILAPYLDGIVGKLLPLLQNNNLMVQEGAVSAIASVADSSKEHFRRHYEAVMVNLKIILLKATDKCNRMLRAKALECISIIGIAVGKDLFTDDAQQVMKVLALIKGNGTNTYMLQASARICKCLGKDLLPDLLDIMMPQMLESAQLEPDVNSENEERIDIKTKILLEEKATACQLLWYYAVEYTSEILQHMHLYKVVDTLELILGFYDKEVRKAAVYAMMELLFCSAKVTINDVSCVEKLYYILRAVVKACSKEPKLDTTADLLNAVNGCLQMCGHVLDEMEVQRILEDVTGARSNEKAWSRKLFDIAAINYILNPRISKDYYVILNEEYTLPRVEFPFRKTVFLDMDTTLVYSTFSYLATRPPGYDFSVEAIINSKKMYAFVLQRPGLHEFLDTLSANFELVIFTAAERSYASKVMDQLDIDNNLIAHRLYHDSCSIFQENLVKDLGNTGRDKSSYVVVDAYPEAIFSDIPDGVRIAQFMDDEVEDNRIKVTPFFFKPVGLERPPVEMRRDHELVSLLPFFQLLVNVQDVRGLVQLKQMGFFMALDSGGRLDDDEAEIDEEGDDDGYSGVPGLIESEIPVTSNYHYNVIAEDD